MISATGEQLGNMSVDAGIEYAQTHNLDLVEVSPNVNPPVCKVMDYGKFKYKTSKKSQDAKKKQKVVKSKEIKIRPNTEKHDFEFKLNHVKRFLAEGYKVKITVVFRGRQITHQEFGQSVLNRFIEEIGDACIVEQKPKQEDRKLFLILGPTVENKDKKETDN